MCPIFVSFVHNFGKVEDFEVLKIFHCSAGIMLSLDFELLVLGSGRKRWKDRRNARLVLISLH